MKTAYQYRLYPSDKQKISLNNGLRVCRYWYNRMLGERLDWWEQNRCPVNSCPLICHLPELKELMGKNTMASLLEASGVEIAIA
ncbi:MAG: helix-turn-helix domain-containing protein [Coleofasciculus sp. G3-WIS-01]|uniref:helix-turn-helix domain-containing protein n=1 Tax=Coleofasciculus sp. G3-WIS-01 TaxID=3069528 RepID=UPI0032F344FD